MKKNNHMKRVLEQELPYPKLTVAADLKFDEILSLLPDKAESSQKEEAYRGAHYKKDFVQGEQGKKSVLPMEVPEGMEYAEAEVKRTGVMKRILQISLPAVAACLVLVVLFNLNFLQAANPIGNENALLPGNTSEESGLSEVSALPAAFDGQEAKYTVSVHSAIRRNNYVFLDTWLEFEAGKVPPTEQLFAGSVWDTAPRSDVTVTVDGVEAILCRDPVFNRSEDGDTRFQGIVVAVLAEAQGTTAEITIDHLYGVTDAETHSPFDLPEIELTKSAACSVPVEADPVYEISEGDMTINEVTFMSYSNSEDSFSVQLRLPDRNGLYPKVTVNPYAFDGPIDSLERTGIKRYPIDGEEPLLLYEVWFPPLPERTEKVAVMVDYGDKDFPTEYVNGIFLPPLPLADFTIDLESGDVLCGQEYIDDYRTVSYAGLASVYAAGPRFHNHVMAYNWDKIPLDSTLHLTVLTDLNIDLPLVAEIYYMNDFHSTLPLYHTAESVQVDDEIQTFYDNGDVYYLPAGWGTYGDMWNYDLFLPLPENDWGTDGSTWNEFFTVVLRNVVTGEILGSTAASGVRGNVFTIGTQEELLLDPTYGGPDAIREYGKDNLPYELPDPFEAGKFPVDTAGTDPGDTGTVDPGGEISDPPSVEASPVPPSESQIDSNDTGAFDPKGEISNPGAYENESSSMVNIDGDMVHIDGQG